MKENKQTTATYPGNFVSGTPYPEVQPARHTVVQADNQASPPAVLGLGFTVLAVLGIVAVVSVVMLTGLPLAGAALMALPVIAGAGFVLFLAANGDWLAWREIVNVSRNQRLAITEHAALLADAETHRHTEAMRSLDIQEQQAAIDARLQSLQHQLASVEKKLLMAPQNGPTPPNFVQADPDRAMAHNVASAYAVSLYRSPTRGGGPDERQVFVDGNQPGKLRGAVPWSARGRWPDEVDPAIGKRAAELLFAGAHGNPPVIVKVRGGYALNLDAYPTVSDIWQKFG